MINPSLTLFNDFTNELASCNHYLSEDGLRYLFFDCMRRQDPNLNHYILELPFGQMTPSTSTIIPGANLSPLKKIKGLYRQELDLLYGDGNNEILCLEFKYHRRPSNSKTAFDHTNAAGSLFNDLLRLQLINAVHLGIRVRRLLIYVTDQVMDSYLSGSGDSFRNMLSCFYSLPQNKAKCIVFNNPRATFKESAFKSFSNALSSFCLPVKKLYNKDFSTHIPLSTQHHIRVYEIIDIHHEEIFDFAVCSPCATPYLGICRSYRD